MFWFKKKILEHIIPHKGRTYILCHDTFLSIAHVIQNGLLLSGAVIGKATLQAGYTCRWLHPVTQEPPCLMHRAAAYHL